MGPRLLLDLTDENVLDQSWELVGKRMGRAGDRDVRERSEFWAGQRRRHSVPALSLGSMHPFSDGRVPSVPLLCQISSPSTWSLFP